MDIETHPYNLSEIGRVPETTRTLIIGTAPPYRFSRPLPKPLLEDDIDFFYGSRDNDLWTKIIPAIWGRSVLGLSHSASVKACRIILLERRVWMVDVLQSYERADRNSSKDTDLIPRLRTSFRPILERCTEIDTLIFTGASAEVWSGLRLVEEGLIKKGDFLLPGKPRMPRQRSLAIQTASARNVVTFTLPSPSPLGDIRYKHSKLGMYRDVLVRD